MIITFICNYLHQLQVLFTTLEHLYPQLAPAYDLLLHRLPVLPFCH